MSIVTGKLNTFGVAQLVNVQAKLAFIPNAPGVVVSLPVSYWLATAPVYAVIGVDGESFSVDLWPSEYVSPAGWYTPQLSWLDPAGNYILQDFTGWKLRVPVDGGSFGDLIERPLGFGEIWTTTVAGDPVGSVRGDYVLDTITGNLDQIA